MKNMEMERKGLRQVRERMERKKNLNEMKKALYVIDMNNGFVNFGPMANTSYLNLVPEQQKLIEKFRSEKEQVNFVLEGHNENATEFKKYPSHCIKGTEEAELIPEFQNEILLPQTNVYEKNSTMGMFNQELQQDMKQMTNLQEAVFCGVCADLCVMDFARPYARFLDEINKEAVLFAVKSAIDTFDSPEHNREEWLNIAYKVMEQAGIITVENFEELEEYERKLGLK